MSDYLTEGQIVKVKVMETDEKGRIKLSMKALIERPAGMSERPERADRPERSDRGDRPERNERNERNDRGGERHSRGERSERNDRNDRPVERNDYRDEQPQPQPQPQPQQPDQRNYDSNN